MTKNYRMNEKDNSHQWHRWLERKNLRTPNGSWTCDFLVFDSDAPPLSYRRLVRARSLSKLGSRRSSWPSWFMWQESYIRLYCEDWNVEMCSVMRNEFLALWIHDKDVLFSVGDRTSRKNLRPLTTGPDTLPKKLRLSHAALDKVYVVASNISHDYSLFLSVKERAFTIVFHTAVMVACTWLWSQRS